MISMSEENRRSLLLFIIAALFIMMAFGFLNGNSRNARPFPEIIAVPDVF
ncbi:hypothetical protein [Heliorestis acidaminivorans]|nr:hypothetical protein [Heliorestis acidaminivorans]